MEKKLNKTTFHLWINKNNRNTYDRGSSSKTTDVDMCLSLLFLEGVGLLFLLLLVL